MNRIYVGAVVAVLALAGSAAAQPPGPFQVAPPRSPLSPFLNLTLGRNPAVNYFTAVQPLLDQQRYGADRQVLQETLQRRSLTFDDLEDQLPTNPETGHVVRFLNYGSFYNLGNQPRSAALYPGLQQQKRR